MNAYCWRGGIYLHSFLALALYGGEWSASRRGRFPPREISPGTNSIDPTWSGCRAQD